MASGGDDAPGNHRSHTATRIKPYDSSAIVGSVTPKLPVIRLAYVPADDFRATQSACLVGTVSE